MLSSGTRIGPHRITSWLGEGSCGQSYRCESTANSSKGEFRYVKLISRELSDRKGFGDFFEQECQALLQLEGVGLWPMKDFGIMKWKHWISYEWFEGKAFNPEPDESDPASEERQGFEVLRTLEDKLRLEPDSITKDSLLGLMTDLHRGLHKAHLNGFIHGNLKPSNILITENESNPLQAWIAEFGLYRFGCFKSRGEDGNDESELPTLTLDAQQSHEMGARFRPKEAQAGVDPEEKWDLFAMGQVVRRVIECGERPETEWEDWSEWATRACSDQGFPSVAHSMAALPGMEDLSEFGITVETDAGSASRDNEEIRLEREREWALAEKISTLRFRRNMTGFAGVLSFIAFILSFLYLFLFPAPWTEYSMEGVLDSYQLGAGLWGGQAWGIVPGAYDDEGSGGQNVVGEWEKEDGMFKMSFRRFKKINDQKGDKKLWQFIGQGNTSPNDYYNWTDYLRYDRKREVLLLIKRVDDRDTYFPGKTKDGGARLYPRERFSRSGGEIVAAELVFPRKDGRGRSWELFFAFGFLLASSLYHRELRKVEKTKFGKD